ncbi:ABC transporter ATP-binding protein [Pseudalkalibacillus sp. Hm43]|uniref:ABC transporter ATP-binding protein n=1 Tax=Pseudalkalibacillus sp. Hm43 TaxID=3450742 RepID=UPI003F443B00
MDPILKIDGLKIFNSLDDQVIVNNLSLEVEEKQIVGLIGESGSGKSITASAILGALPPELKKSGTIRFYDQDLSFHDLDEIRKVIGSSIGYIPQDYNSGFSPFFKIGHQMDELLQTHTSLNKKQRKVKIYDMLERVKLQPHKVFDSYLFQLSGGQLQRAVIASAMILEPKLLICDEVTTALDGENAEEILNLLNGLREDFGTAIIFISHQLNQVLKISDVVAVMYGGEIMEIGEIQQIKRQAIHPYTRLLMEAKPRITNGVQILSVIPGEPGDIHRNGCPFARRCPFSGSECFEIPVVLSGKGSHRLACHHYSKLSDWKEDEHVVARSPVHQ